MDVPVIITPTATDDLEEIVRHIGHHSPERAGAFGQMLIQQAESLSHFPEMGRVTLEIDDPNVREIVHGAYRIIYEVRRNPAAVYVLRFWHAARGTPEIPDE